MRKYLLIAFLICPLFAWAYDPFDPKTPCPQIDLKVKDRDGVPFCPCEVKAGTAWAVFRCAVQQATSFHAPTEPEKMSMTNMLQGWQNHISEEVMKAAEQLNLQVCRVSQLNKAQPDTYLVIYVKPGVTDYSGPFFMLRETKHSKVLVIGPHDDSDSTWEDTKLATSATLAMGTVSNGHMRGKVRKPDSPKGYADFVHTPGGSKADLGTFAIERICAMNMSSVVFHVHGMHDQTKVLYRARQNSILERAYEETVIANTYVRSFAPLNAYFTIDPLVNTNWYIKTEIPSTIHRQDRTALARMVIDLEKNSWAW